MGDPKTLLIVESDPEVADTMAEHFEDLGYAVDQSQDALDAVVRISTSPPRAVVMGLTTPRLGGVDGMRLLRRWRPGLPIVLNDSESLTARTASGPGPERDEEWRALERLVELATAHPAAEAVVRARPHPEPAGIERSRILVVDDVEEVRDMLRDVLEAEGYAVEAAGDAGTAIARLGSFRPQAVLLDIAMPGLSGIGALQQLRARDPELGVIMVTANEDESTARQTLVLGAFDYVQKPIDLDYLRRSLRTLLALRSLAAGPGV
jgi:DNA-binding response OmpR family regulator